MSLLGKILTVGIAFASFALMIVAMFVYATHRNWRDDYTAVQKQLQEAQAANTSLETKYQNQIMLLNAEHEAAQQEVRKLESELATVAQQNATTQAEVDQLRADRSAATGLVAATEENNTRLTNEVVALRESIRESQAARDQSFATTLKATSELHTTAGQLQSIRERSEQLIKQLAQATSALLENNIDPAANVIAQARGVVNATRRAGGQQLVEISIGSDDGVRPGQTVEIFRGERYLGRARIVRSDPDRAVGEILREFQQGPIQQGDDVATKLSGGR
ncbi:MAG TPA: hypothetical protein VEQ85_05305 [Lacipirellulaceae bacterium]|nr:hypothetical protein [Lacipirellulaceae bacterium]